MGVALVLCIGVVSLGVGAFSVPAGVAVVICLLTALSAVLSALQTSLTAALYHYGADGTLVGEFTEAHFVAAFRGRQPRSDDTEETFGDRHDR
jgi:hypothetical protein